MLAAAVWSGKVRARMQQLKPKSLEGSKAAPDALVALVRLLARQAARELDHRDREPRSDTTLLSLPENQK
jgi:hypothetical protein